MTSRQGGAAEFTDTEAEPLASLPRGQFIGGRWRSDASCHVGLNRDHVPLVAEMPHGGFKHSGYGKDLSMYGLEDYTRVKHVMANIDL